MPVGTSLDLLIVPYFKQTLSFKSTQMLREQVFPFRVLAAIADEYFLAHVEIDPVRRGGQPDLTLDRAILCWNKRAGLIDNLTNDQERQRIQDNVDASVSG